MGSKLLKSVSLAAIALLMAPIAGAQTVVPTQPIIGIPAGATIPRVVSTNPVNMSRNVNSSLRQITITFDQPMDVAAFYWQIPQVATFPRLTDQPYWTNGNKTIVIPVLLGANTYYEIPLNIGQQNFRAATGVPLQSAKLQFWTLAVDAGSGFSGHSNPNVTHKGGVIRWQPPNQPGSTPATGTPSTSGFGTGVKGAPVTGGTGSSSGGTGGGTPGALNTTSFSPKSGGFKPKPAAKTPIPTP